jgi:type I restriction enzyme M protein
MSNISGILQAIRNIMWQDTGLNGDAQRIEQLGWMLFLKIFSDKDFEMELMDSKYKSPIPAEFHWVKEKGNWAGDDEGMTGDELLEFVDRKLFPALRNINISTGNRRALIVREVFEGNNNYMKSGINLRKVLNKLNEIDFNVAKDRHAFGELYENILKELQSAGKSGEFYTPRAITQFITDTVNPKEGENILDPACGTGGFLTCAIENLKKKANSVEARKALQENVVGWEYKPLPYLLATTNLILHDIEVPNIRFGDALDQPLSNFTEKHRVDAIIANPPFGGIVANNNENNFPQNFRTKESADLFLIMMIHLLKHGGRAGIVLPDSSLTGDGIKQRIRQRLLEECNLHTIIRLPKSVFQPYATVPTNLLFFDKGKPTKDIWYYELRLPEGVKSYNKTKPIRIEEFDPIKKWWKKRTENELSWKVSIDTIIERGYDLDIKNPHIAEEENISPTLLYDELNETKQKANQALSVIADELKRLNNQGQLDFFLEHIDSTFQSEKFVTTLKTLLLFYSMQGELVEQSVNESVADLLQTVKLEKEKLIEEKKLPREKPLPEIKDDEIPFKIPMSWQWCRLGEIVQHNSGKTLDSGRNKGNARDYITTSNLYWGYFELTKLKQLLIEDDELERCTARKGDLLVCEGGESGRAAIWNNDYEICFQNHIHRIRPFGNINSKFIYWFFQYLNLSGDINKYRKGMGITNMSGKALASIVFPLPPLSEQRRIVMKLEKLFLHSDSFYELIKKSKEQTEKLLIQVQREALRKEEIEAQ